MEQQNEKLTFATLLKKLQQKQPVSFARYGDGEWNAIFNKKGQNCDKHIYYPEMGARLRDCLAQNPKYFLGMQGLAVRQRETEIKAFIKQNKTKPFNEWSNADILHNASIQGQFKYFFDELNKVENLIIVAPSYMRDIKLMLKYNHFVEIPQINCWEKYQKIFNATAEVIQNTKMNKHTVVLFIASMPANILVHSLYQLFGTEVSLLDIGSVFDPYVNKATRTYHKNMNIRKINNL